MIVKASKREVKISTEIASAARIIGEEKAIEAYAKAGFDAWDFSMFAMVRYDWGKNICLPTDHPLAGNSYLQFARKLRKIGEDNGIHCNQSHAPFPIYNTEIRSMMKRAIECTAEAGGDICVIHPDNNKSPEENAEMFLELLPFAKEHHVRLATENMWNWNNETKRAAFAACATPESFNAHLDAVNDDSLVACLDIGHAEMMGESTSAVQMIHALGNRLQALHIHDNDQIYDSHQIPLSMKIDFKKVVAALKDIGYAGYFTLEADAYLKGCDDVYQGIQNMADVAHKLASWFEEK